MLSHRTLFANTRVGKGAPVRRAVRFVTGLFTLCLLLAQVAAWSADSITMGYTYYEYVNGSPVNITPTMYQDSNGSIWDRVGGNKIILNNSTCAITNTSGSTVGYISTSYQP